MSKEVIISGKSYQPCDILNKNTLDKGGFNTELSLECAADKYKCLSDGSSKLILEVLAGDNFKIYDIK